MYSFNPRAEKVYLKAGFKREGVLRDAIMDGDKYADDILMSILEDEWRTLKMQRYAHIYKDIWWNEIFVNGRSENQALVI